MRFPPKSRGFPPRGAAFPRGGHAGSPDTTAAHASRVPPGVTQPPPAGLHSSGLHVSPYAGARVPWFPPEYAAPPDRRGGGGG